MVWVWIAFVLFILGMLGIDLFVLNRGSHEIRARDALRFTGLTIVLALLFSIAVYVIFEHGYFGFAGPESYYPTKFPRLAGEGGWGLQATGDYLGAWLLEYALSVDNIFVFSVVFSVFGVPAKFQHRVLFWGVLGALVLRAFMIYVGVKVLHQFDWIIALFGVFLLYTAVKMLGMGDNHVEPDKNLAVRIARRIYPVSSGYDGQRFFTRLADGSRAMTPLLLVLLVIETTDVIFALDSIPAVMGLTQDPFIIFTSNVFAILGLRSMYFALGAFMKSFKYLKSALVFILAFIGVKMLLEGVPHLISAATRLTTEWGWTAQATEFHAIEIPNYISLSVLVSILLVGVVTSMLSVRRDNARNQTPLEDLAEAADIAWRNTRRGAILLIGLTIVGLSFPIGMLPGPGGIAVAIAGLMILATEFIWAQKILKRMQGEADRLNNRANVLAKRTNPWIVLPVVVGYIALVIYLAHFAEWMPDWHAQERTIYFVALGPLIAIGIWAYKVFATHFPGLHEKVRTMYFIVFGPLIAIGMRAYKALAARRLQKNAAQSTPPTGTPSEPPKKI